MLSSGKRNYFISPQTRRNGFSYRLRRVIHWLHKIIWWESLFLMATFRWNQWMVKTFQSKLVAWYAFHWNQEDLLLFFFSTLLCHFRPNSDLQLASRINFRLSQHFGFCCVLIFSFSWLNHSFIFRSYANGILSMLQNKI